jgi:hypothetical protein
MTFLKFYRVSNPARLYYEGQTVNRSFGVLNFMTSQRKITRNISLIMAIYSV